MTWSAPYYFLSVTPVKFLTFPSEHTQPMANIYMYA